MVGYTGAQRETALMVGSAHPTTYRQTLENTQFPAVCSIDAFPPGLSCYGRNRVLKKKLGFGRMAVPEMDFQTGGESILNVLTVS